MIKVLHSVLSLEVGGLENGIVNLINAMPDDMQVDVLCLRGMGSLVERILHPRARVIQSHTIEDHSIMGGIKGHLHALKHESYDIIHTHGWATMLSGALAVWTQRLMKMSAKPLIINGEHGVYYDQDKRKKIMQKWLFQKMDGNLTVSADLGRRMEQAFSLPAKTFFPILNGVDTAKFTPNPQIRQSRRSDLGVVDSDFVIGTVGRLVEIKNYPMLIRVFKQIHELYPQTKLVFCGDGDQRAHLESLVSESGLNDSVIFTGRINNVAETMQAFDLFALTSHMEGLPNTLLEAMASGIPSVVTDVGGSREVMPQGGGFLIPPAVDDALFDKLQALIANEDLRFLVREKALAHIQQHLSIDAMAQAYYNYYRELLSTSSGK